MSARRGGGGGQMESMACAGPARAWRRAASRAVATVEQAFYALGCAVGAHPRRTALLAGAFLLLSAAGLLRLRPERDPMRLWVPPDSDFYRDTAWYAATFRAGVRPQAVLLAAQDALAPSVLRELAALSDGVRSVGAVCEGERYTIRDLCLEVPAIGFSNRRNGRSIKTNDTSPNRFFSEDLFEDEERSTPVRAFEPSVDLSPEIYCDIVNNFKKKCYETNIIDIWQYDLNVLKNLTRREILDKINLASSSPTTGLPMNYSSMLGKVKRDDTGKIISAESVLLTWYLHVNFSAVDIDKVGNLVGTEDWATLPILAWEREFLKFMESYAQNVTGVELYYQAGRSFGDISGATMFQEMDKLFLGIALMFIYIQIVLSEFNCLEIRLTLGSVGLLCVGMAYVTACSWCSLFGIPYGPVHASLPFLLMGLGIDDMFVMKACWEQLTHEDRQKSLNIQVGLMLKHAGVSIVITSFTDIVAFLIGSITILPSLRSFCFYAAAGVFFIFCFSVTFYVAIFTLDVRRIQANRNGILFCYKHKNSIQVKQGPSRFQRLFESFYKNFIFTVPMKVLVIAFTVVMTAFSIEAVLRLEQKFDPDWFIPDDTYFKQFLDKHKYYYPDDGHLGLIFLGKMNYHEEYPNLYEMVQTLKNESYIIELNSWVDVLHDYVSVNFGRNLVHSEPTFDEFQSYLSKFLYSQVGGSFQQNFKFSTSLICGQSAPNITASSIQFRFKRFEGPDQYLPAMHKMKDIVKFANITTGDGYRSVWSKIFANWVTDEIIGVEVERNVELALLCVMACTVVLITNLQMCLWIFLCVLLTLINVCGWMQRWGMTVDIVSCIGLELAIGLCVDYAAHVGHTFLTITEGTRSSRSLKTITSIGAAVMYGGGSTLLSLSVLSMSKAYTFSSFFKIFLLVIIFGLFHGLVFLPVMLSLIGPEAYHRSEEEKNNATKMEVIELNIKNDQQSDDCID